MLDDIYSEILMENARLKDKKISSKKANEYDLSENVHSEEGVNASCGDEIKLYLNVSGKDILKAQYIGDGCAISEASANILCKLIEGKDIDFAKEFILKFKEFMLSSNDELEKNELNNNEKIEDYLKEAYSFKGIRYMPSRINCALLSYNTLETLIEKI